MPEYDGLGSVCWLGELGEHDPGNPRLELSRLHPGPQSQSYRDQHSDDALEAHHQHGSWTLGGDHPPPVPDGVLGLHTEQEGGGEVHHVLNTHPVGDGELGLQVS